MEAWTSLRRTQIDLDELRRSLDEHKRTHSDSPYAKALRESVLVQEVLAAEVPFVWAITKSCADRPEKITASRKELDGLLLGREAVPIIGHVQTDLVLVSPYFVPGRKGVEWIRTLRDRGVRVRILTNSLAATDVPIVHAGYSRYREELLELGVELYELQPTAREERGNDRHGLLGSSGASLHAKTFVFDEKTLFVGSLNLDPRSAKLNTEQGLLVESPELARRVIELFERGAKPANSYRLVLEAADGATPARMTWLGEEGGRPVRFTSEPHTSFWKRCTVAFGGLLPIEDQL
jgi:putative cardiolipin synthase